MPPFISRAATPYFQPGQFTKEEKVWFLQWQVQWAFISPSVCFPVVTQIGGSNETTLVS